MELIEIEQRPMTQDKMRQLADKVREAAYESVERLWSAVLDVVDMDTAQCFEQALAALLELRNYDKAMGMVTGLFALCGVEITAGIVACQKYPALMRMFLAEFLAETGEYLNDRDIAELMCAPGE